MSVEIGPAKSLIPDHSWWTCPRAQKDYTAFRQLAAKHWLRMERNPESSRVSSTRGLAGSTSMGRLPAANASGEVAA